MSKNIIRDIAKLSDHDQLEILQKVIESRRGVWMDVHLNQYAKYIEMKIISKIWSHTKENDGQSVSFVHVDGLEAIFEFDLNFSTGGIYGRKEFDVIRSPLHTENVEACIYSATREVVVEGPVEKIIEYMKKH